MRLESALILPQATASFANPISLFNFGGKRDVENVTFTPCFEGSTDPICQLVRQPSSDVITEIVHANGTVETKRYVYTREQLHDIRKRNNVPSVEVKPGQAIVDRSAEFIGNLTKRENSPAICWTVTQKWFDQHDWGYWYQAWKQVGNCFYCDQCTEAIAINFAVTQTWTVGLAATFNSVLQVSFGYSWGRTYGLTDTRTCQWNYVESGCHSIWYQPLMSYHNGYPNYQTHTHCSAAQGSPASDSYYDHKSSARFWPYKLNPISLISHIKVLVITGCLFGTEIQQTIS